MTTSAKYIYSYIGGGCLWAVVLYEVGFKLLGWPLRPLTIGYIALMAWIGGAQLAVYRGEGIAGYAARLRYRLTILACFGLVGSAGLVGWALLSTSTRWTIVALCEITVATVTIVSAWLAYKLSLWLRLGRWPRDSESPADRSGGQ